MALYDRLAILLHLLREALHVCSPHGRLRTQEQVRSELMHLFDMIEELNCAAISTALKPLHTHIDDLVVPFAQAEAIEAELRAVVPHHVLDFLVLAWHHDHFSFQSPTKPKRYHHRERDFWLAGAEGLLGDAFDSLKALVFDKLDSIVRASSLVEMVNSLIRPYLNSCKGQITQEALNLIMFYHNHRRYKSGKRKGQAPLELLTGDSLEAEWWALLLHQVTQEEAVTDNGARPSRPPLHLMVNDGGHTERQAMAPDQALVAPPGTPEHERRQTVLHAA
jgi:hypothetical protein